MFRTLLIEEGERLSVAHQVLQIEKQGRRIPVPIDDIYCIVLDNLKAVVTTAAINALCTAGAHIVICNEKHLPSAVIYPELIHYAPYRVVTKQMGMTQGWKDALWDKIVKGKLANQAETLRLCTGDMDAYHRLMELADEVEEGDSGNREGIGAKLYFRHFFGDGFVRMEDDGINHAMNYGYTILRTAMIKTLYTFGYYPLIGIHHIGYGNAFNLGDDLMEPFRPVVDMWVELHHEELLGDLTSQQRRSLVNLLNQEMDYDGCRMKIRNVMARYVKQYTSAIEKESVELLRIPTITATLFEAMKAECHES